MSISRDELKRMMPDSFPIFFYRRDPYQGQALVMPEIVKGRNILFAAPTASGKTEAAIAPLYQRHVSFRRKALSTVYVAPTKALVNDLYERLMNYFGTHSLESISRYTGDHHDYSKADGVFCLLTTPEGLDSLQLRRPHLLKSVRAIVIDEIHLLHGVARGQQLRHVIDRIEASIELSNMDRDNFQIVGMTATLSEMPSVAETWLGENAKHFSEGTPREIDLQLIDTTIDESEDVEVSYARNFAKWLRKSEAKKVLIFTNSRNRAHGMAANLKSRLVNSRWPVHLHMGPVSKNVREKIEDRMRSDKFGICIATSTLEIGIDIGDIDLIVLADKPFSVSSFLQRIGRGNRRTGTCKVVGFRTDDFDEKYYHALIDCSKRGELDDVYEYDRPSVRFQQVLSLAWHSIRNDRSITISKIAKAAGTSKHNQVIQDMLKTGCLKESQNVLILNDELMDVCDSGGMHSVIVGGANNPVVDKKTGKLAVTDTEESMYESTIFHDGQLRELKLATDGSQYLGEKTENPKLLAKFKSFEMPPKIEKCMVWAMARQSSFNPLLWLMDETCLVTWGGKNLNILLAEIFNRYSTEYTYSCNDTSINGDFSEFSVSINRIKEMAEKCQRSNVIPMETASKFTGGSRFKSELSEEMQIEEQTRSIPWPVLFKWLDAVKSIDQVDSVPNEISKLLE